MTEHTCIDADLSEEELEKIEDVYYNEDFDEMVVLVTGNGRLTSLAPQEVPVSSLDSIDIESL